MTSRGRTIAIGDVHGCAHALESLLSEIAPEAQDTLICLGDFIDTGRDTKEVIELLLQLDSKCDLICLLGNHEEMLLSAMADPKLLPSWLACGGQSTVNSYRFCGGLADISDEHVAFIRRCRDYWETSTHLFTHANYEPELPLSEMEPYTLRWSPVDEQANYRMHYSGKPVLVGHTEQRNGEVLDKGSLICIDTYCHAYGWLTALEVDKGRIWQASRWGALREGEDLADLQRAQSMLQADKATT